MPENTYLQQNIRLLNYNLGLIFLGSVAWIPFENSHTYYQMGDAAWHWFLVFIGLLAGAFALSTLMGGVMAALPFHNWPYEKKFYRFFLISGLWVVPLLSAIMVYVGHAWEYLP